MNEWKSDLLKDISSVPKVGSPGRIVVFGEQAEPILTGVSEEDIIMAAAEIGNGRLVAFSHDGYAVKMFTDNSDETVSLTALHNNVKSWITHGTELNDGDVLNLNDEDASEEKLRDAKLVYWCGGESEQLITSEVVLDFINNGGAFVHAICPWGWKQLNNDKNWKDMPYWMVLESLGICYSEEIVYDSKSEYEVIESKASDAHLLRFIQTYSEKPDEVLNKAGLIRSLGYVPKDSASSMALYSALDSVWDICSSRIQDCVPSSERPTSTPEERGVLEMWKVCANFLGKLDKAPGCEIFPGDFESSPPASGGELEFHSTMEEIFPTGYYATAGEMITVEILEGNPDQNWRLHIGAHEDVLEGEEFRRWPDVHTARKIDSEKITVSSPFGGLIYLQSPVDESSFIHVRLEDVVLAPQFNLLDGSEGVINWIERRKAPGLWADIIGKYVIVTLPSSSVREVDDPTDVMNIWDRVVGMFHDLRGTDVDKYRRQWIVTDEQPSVGYMHSGYPIVTHLDVASPAHKEFILNAQNLTNNGYWGLFHEIGHNMQSSDWTYDGAGEVSNNVFTLHAMDLLCGRKPWLHDFLRDNLEEATSYLNQGANFDTWKSLAGTALFIYAQMIRDFGWESYRKVFRRYNSMSEEDKPTTDQQKIDTWFMLFSEETSYSFSPLALFWGVPLTEELVNTMQTYQQYLPDDELTRAAPERTDLVLQQFPGVLRFVTPALENVS